MKTEQLYTYARSVAIEQKYHRSKLMSDTDKSILSRLDNVESRLDKIESALSDDFKYSRAGNEVDAIKKIIGI